MLIIINTTITNGLRVRMGLELNSRIKKFSSALRLRPLSLLRRLPGSRGPPIVWHLSSRK